MYGGVRLHSETKIAWLLTQEIFSTKQGLMREVTLFKLVPWLKWVSMLTCKKPPSHFHLRHQYYLARNLPQTSTYLLHYCSTKAPCLCMLSGQILETQLFPSLLACCSLGDFSLATTFRSSVSGSVTKLGCKLA